MLNVPRAVHSVTALTLAISATVSHAETDEELAKELAKELANPVAALSRNAALRHCGIAACRECPVRAVRVG